MCEGPSLQLSVLPPATRLAHLAALPRGCSTVGFVSSMQCWGLM